MKRQEPVGFATSYQTCYVLFDLNGLLCLHFSRYVSVTLKFYTNWLEFSGVGLLLFRDGRNRQGGESM